MTAAALTSPDAAARTVTTVRSEATGPLLDLLPAAGGLSWVRRGEGMVGWGEAARLEVSGPGALATASAWWADFTAALDVDDEVGVPGSGPVVFAGVAFDPERETSVFVVPEVVVGRRDGIDWVTSLGDADPALPKPAETDDGPTLRLRYADGALDPASWCAAVAAAVRRSSSSGVAPRRLSTAKVQQSGKRAPSRRRIRRGSRGASAVTSRSRASTTLAMSPASIRRTAVATAAHQLAGSMAPSA